MTAALRKIDSPRSPRFRQRVSAKNSSNKLTYLPLASPSESPSPPLPKKKVVDRHTVLGRENFNGKIANQTNPWAKPIWLRSLLGMNTATAIAMLIVVSAVVGLYSKVVYTKQNWGQEYRKLERLQKEERQVTIFNEALKNDIAQTAKQDGTGLVAPNGAAMILLEPTPVRPLREATAPQPENFQSLQPLGY
jgi:hypothetical protein